MSKYTRRGRARVEASLQVGVRRDRGAVLRRYGEAVLEFGPDAAEKIGELLAGAAAEVRRAAVELAEAPPEGGPAILRAPRPAPVRARGEVASVSEQGDYGPAGGQRNRAQRAGRVITFAVVCPAEDVSTPTGLAPSAGERIAIHSGECASSAAAALLGELEAERDALRREVGRLTAQVARLLQTSGSYAPASTVKEKRPEPRPSRFSALDVGDLAAEAPRRDDAVTFGRDLGFDPGFVAGQVVSMRGSASAPIGVVYAVTLPFVSVFTNGTLMRFLANDLVPA